MRTIKPYLLLFTLLGTLSLKAQEINNKTIVGEWIGYDNKGQKVTLVFTETILRTLSMYKPNSFNYSIETNTNGTYLLLEAPSNKKRKIKWMLSHEDNGELQITFPAGEKSFAILFHRAEHEKISMTRLKTELGDTDVQYITVIRYGVDSVKAVRTVQLPRPVPKTIADTILTDIVYSDQLELSAGWDGGNGLGVVFNMAPSTGFFFIDKLEVKTAEWQPTGMPGKDEDLRFPVCITYWMNKTMNFFWLEKEEIIYPADSEKALSTLKRFAKLTP